MYAKNRWLIATCIPTCHTIFNILKVHVYHLYNKAWAYQYFYSITYKLACAKKNRHYTTE